MSVAVKICGLMDKEALHTAIEAGASFLGFVFVPTSKRCITTAEARDLLATLPHPALCRFQHYAPSIQESNALVLTALFADATDKDIMEACHELAPFLGLVQLHGHETPERAAQIHTMTGLPVMKAIPIATADDFACVKEYEPVVDMLLFDTKVGKATTGGTGKSFDWSLLTERTFTKPWMLAGGLNAKNIKQAVRLSGSKMIDLSSGAETNGKKSPEKIKAILQAAYAC